ncbi:MAG: MFS transporter [Pyrodictiaceae archaeon]
MEEFVNWRANLRLAITASFLVQIVYGLLWSIYAPFLRAQGFSGTLYGIIGSASVFSSIAGSLAGGWFSDKFNPKWILWAGLILNALGTIVLSLGGFYQTLVASIATGFGGGVAWVSLAALLGKMIPDSEMDTAFSYMNAANLFGGAVGSFMGWIPVIYHESIGVSLFESYKLFLRVGALALLLAVTPFILRLRFRGHSVEEGKVTSQGAIPWPIFYKLTIVEMIIGFGAALSIHNIDYYFVLKYGVSSAELGTTLGLQQGLMGTLTLLMPRFSRRVGGPLRAYIILTSSSIPLLILMTLVNNFAIAASLYIARSILMNVANPLYQAFQMTLLPREFRGRGSAILGIAWQVPVGLGRSVGGALLDIDLELPLRITAVLYTVALTLLATFFPEQVRSGKARFQFSS